MKRIHPLVGLCLALITFYLWWGHYSNTPVNFRGVGVAESAHQPYQIERDTFRVLSCFCKDLPVCYRVFLPWVGTAVQFVIFRPLIYLLQRDWIGSMLACHLSSSWILALAYVYAFYAFTVRLPRFYAFAALISFGQIPMFIPSIGVGPIDPVALLWWSLYIQFFIAYGSENEVGHQFLKRTLNTNKKILIFTALSAVCMTWTMDNMGVGLSIALFFLALTKRFHKIQLPLIRMWIVSSIFTISAYGAVTLITHLIHPDAFFNAPGSTMKDMLKLYGSYYNFWKMWDNLEAMVRVPVTVGIICFLLTLLFGKSISEITESDERNASLIVWVSTAGLLGFSFTAAVGRYVAGLYFEWTRQFLPFAYLGTWLIFGSLILIVSALIKSKPLPADKNSKPLHYVYEQEITH